MSEVASLHPFPPSSLPGDPKSRSSRHHTPLTPHHLLPLLLFFIPSSTGYPSLSITSFSLALAVSSHIIKRTSSAFSPDTFPYLSILLSRFTHLFSFGIYNLNHSISNPPSLNPTLPTHTHTRPQPSTLTPCSLSVQTPDASVNNIFFMLLSPRGCSAA